MGYYIDWPGYPPVGKAERLVLYHGAVVLDHPPASVKAIPLGQVLVCVLNRKPSFEAALVVYDDRELEEAQPTWADPTARTWLLVDRSEVYALCPRVMKVMMY